MKLTRLAFGLVLGLAAAGCGSDDNTCPDGGVCPDSAVSPADAGATGDAPVVGTITSGKYKATAAVITDDGCKIDPMALVTMNTSMDAWLPVDISGGTMKVGNDRGTPAAPSLGSGPYSASSFTFKLTRMNHVAVGMGSSCEYDSDVTSTITQDAIDSFGIGVVEKQTNRKNCMVPAGVGESCASTWSWRMVKAQ
jgi:hypothetical protein